MDSVHTHIHIHIHTRLQLCFGVDLVFFSISCLHQVSGIDCWDPTKRGV